MVSRHAPRVPACRKTANQVQPWPPCWVSVVRPSDRLVGRTRCVVGVSRREVISRTTAKCLRGTWRPSRRDVKKLEAPLRSDLPRDLAHPRFIHRITFRHLRRTPPHRCLRNAALRPPSWSVRRQVSQPPRHLRASRVRAPLATPACATAHPFAPTTSSCRCTAPPSTPRCRASRDQRCARPRWPCSSPAQ